MQQSYVPPAIVEIGSLHEHTMALVVGSDGHTFGGLTGFLINNSVVCPKRRSHPPGSGHGRPHALEQVIPDSDHIGFSLPKAVI